MKSFSKIYTLIGGILLCSNFAYGQLHITEFQSSNLSTILDAYGNYLEWVEIYNSGSSKINLDGYTLSDDFEHPSKCILRNVSINAGSYKLIWLDSEVKDGYCDLNLDPSGGELALFSPNGQLMDSLRFGRQALNASYGRYPLTQNSWFHYAEPTPGQANSAGGLQDFAQSDPVNFSLVGGMYSGSESIQLFADSNEGIIRYTTDGSWPTKTSLEYTSPIYLTETTAIRARLFEQEKLPGDVVTQTYILNDETTVPVICITADPDDFFSNNKGMYVEGTNGSMGWCFDDPANWNNDWERPINFEYFTPEGIQEINQLAGSKMAGKCSRSRPFKSMGVFARKKYGDKRLNYQFFRSKNEDEFKSIVLRNGGNDSWKALMRDGFMQTLLIDQMDIDYQAFEPAIVFLNGEYWGILNIREKINEHYPASNYKFDSDEIDMLEYRYYANGIDPISGSGKHYSAMMEYVMNNDLSDQSHFDYVATQMDINEFLNYYLVEIYFENFDWPTNNMKLWRPRVEGGKWRWALYDTDFGWGLYTGEGNIIKYSTTIKEEWTRLIRGLLDNDGFRNEYYQRMAALCNTVFDPVRVSPILDSISAIMDAEIERHYIRWNTPRVYTYMKNTDEIMPEFTQSRPGEMLKIMKDNFGLSGVYELCANSSDPNMGSIKACNLDLPLNFTGTFFNDVPLRLEAVPRSGYTFSHWEGASNSNNANIYLDLSADATITAVFNEAVPLDNIVINELDATGNEWIEDNYGQMADWIEVYNGNDFEVNMAGWYLSDSIGDNTKFMIPAGYPDLTTIEAGGYMVLWCDASSKQGPLHANFKLDRDGETISLFQAVGDSLYLRDSIQYPKIQSETTYGLSLVSGNWEFLFPTPKAANLNEDYKELYINEFLTKNMGLFRDDSGEADDWIEVYNPTADTIDLGGLYMTDSLADPLKFRIPSHLPVTQIPPYGYKLLWADGEPEQGALHLGFKLDGNNEQIGLYQISVGYIDSMTYLKEHPESVLGRYPDGSSNVQMISATPDESNQERFLENVYINEFMAINGSSHVDEYGESDDWIELYNDNDFPVDVGGTFMTDSLGNCLRHRIPACEPDSTTIPAKGYLVLWADNQEFQGVLHLGFKLSGEGEEIGLISPDGEGILDSLAYIKALPDLARGRLEDGSSNIQMVYASPGEPNREIILKNVYINEFMAINVNSHTDEYGESDDWIELYNDNDFPVDVGGTFMTDSLGNCLRHRIPACEPDSTTIPAKGYLVLWADNQESQGVLHLGFKLSGEGEEIGLISPDGEGILDSLAYIMALPDLARGRLEDGSSNIQMVDASPGEPNRETILKNVYINEFMAINVNSQTDEYGEFDDWIELYNDNDFPVDVGGTFMTDSLGNHIKHRIPSSEPDSTTIPAKGHLLLWADNQEFQGVLHLGFKLSGDGEEIGISQANGLEYIDSLSYQEVFSNQALGILDYASMEIEPVSQSPGSKNYLLPTEKLYISELVASDNEIYQDESGEYDDWIEIYNDNPYPVDIGGFFISDSLQDLTKFRIRVDCPDSTTINPNESLVLWADNQPEQGVRHLGLKLKGKGEQLALICQNGDVIIDSLSFPDQYSHFSYSRQNNNGDWKFFRPTWESSNVSPVITGIHINEFMVSSTSISDDYGEYDDLIELRNFNDFPVDVGGMYLTDSIGEPTKYRIPSHSPELTTIEARGYYVLYADGQSEQGIHHTNFRLSREGGQIGLVHFDEETIIDSLTYQEQYKNASIGRIDGNLAWTPILPSPGAQNEVPDYSALVINELMGSNNTVYCDENNEYDDWIELYNGGDKPIDIGGVFISDSLADRTQFRISSEYPDSTTILPNEYLVLWADGSEEEGILHMDLKIAKTGETIFMYGQNSTLIDSVTYPFLSPNLSWGRIIDGDKEWTPFYQPTPLRPNLYTGIDHSKTENTSFKLYPNPVSNQATFELWLEEPGRIRIEIVSSLGSVVSILQYDHEETGRVYLVWDALDDAGNRLEEGFYIYRISHGSGYYSGKFLVQ